MAVKWNAVAGILCDLKVALLILAVLPPAQPQDCRADDEELQKMRDYQQELGKTCSEIAMKSAIKVADILSQEES